MRVTCEAPNCANYAAYNMRCTDGYVMLCDYHADMALEIANQQKIYAYIRGKSRA